MYAVDPHERPCARHVCGQSVMKGRALVIFAVRHYIQNYEAVIFLVKHQIIT